MTEPAYKCEHCNAKVLESDAHLKEAPRYEGPITIAFCPDCTNL